MSSLHVTVGLVATIEIRRAEKANAYHRATLEALEQAIRELSGSARVVVVQAAGEGAFCAGADLTELAAATPEEALDLRSQRVFTALARAPFVSVAAIHGPAIAGGFELALACDLRVAGPRARFGLPEPDHGLIPSAGGTTRLTRLVGPGRAKEVILGGRVVEAEAALDWGLVHRVVADPRAEAREWAEAIAKRDPVALRLAKGIIDLGEDEASLRLERVSEAWLYSRR